MKKILYYFLGFLLLLVIAYCALCALGTQNFNTERSLKIDAPKTMLFNMVNDYKTWEQWSPWYDKDPEMKVEYGSTTEGVGATYTWIGNEEVGEGKMTAIESTPSAIHKSKMEFVGFDDPSTAIFTFDEVDEQTEVTWKLHSDENLPFFLRGFMTLIRAKKSMENDFDNGLSKMATLAADRLKNKVYDGYKIKEITLPEKHYILNRQSVDLERVQQFYASNLGSLFGKAQRSEVEMDGMPCGLFYSFNDDTKKVDMAAAMPIKIPLSIDGAQSLTLPESEAIQVDFYGDYNGTPKAHAAIEAYMKDFGILHNPPYIEEYVTDPGEQPDPKKWLTKITYYFNND